jgi:multidrug efflux pump subunit AcrB
MNFATWSIRNPIPAILLFLLLTLSGVWGLYHLNTQNFPDLDLPTITASLRLPGAAPSQLETEVARKVEDSLATITQLKHIRTNITDGLVYFIVEFALEKNLSDALTDVKDAIDRVRNNLPTDLQEPQVNKVTTGPGGAMGIYAVSSTTRSEEAISWLVDNQLSKAILAVAGVGDFSRVGGVQREVQVLVDPAKLAALGVTASDISRALKRVQQEASGGRGQLGGAEQGVRTIATVQRAEELASLPIVLSDGRAVRLDHVAMVSDTVAERTQAALLDGKPAVGFQVIRTKGYDETRIMKNIEKILDQIRTENPDLTIQLVRSTIPHLQEQYHGSMQMLYEGAILAVLVIWWFLRDWRATLIGAVALPLSIIPTFAFMAWAHFSLNTITLLALAVVVGILVDDAIVEVENIARHAKQGKSVTEATIDAVNEIAIAVIATTATLVVVFLPTAFMSGIPGMVFRQFGWSIVIAVLVSLLVARLITPMMAAWLIRSTHTEEHTGLIMRWYLSFAAWCLHHRKTTLIFGIGFFIGSLMLIPLLATGFIPPSDEGFTNVSLEMPPGSSLSSTLKVAEEARQQIQSTEGVRSIFTTIGVSLQAGRNAPSVGEVRKGSIMVMMTPRGTRPKQQLIENELRHKLQSVAGARFALGVGGPGEKLQVILASQDAAGLKNSAQNLERDLRTLGYLGSIASTASLERVEVQVKPYPTLMAERGVHTQNIGETLRIALSGDFDAALAKLNLEQRQLDIRVQLPESVRHDISAISALRVSGRAGLVPLHSIADITLGSGPSQIDRYDRQRQVTLTADLGGYPLGEALKAMKKLPSVQTMPSSVHIIESGDAEIMVELFTGFAMALVTGILCVYCVLVLLFKDWFQPITILSAVPLSVGGAFVAILIAKAQLGLPVLIGLVMLLGIVTKNSILLVDFAVLGIEQYGLSPMEAILDACRKRARPIMMTTVAMVAGMLPLAFGLGGDASFRQPMAVAVIGGLMTSTALSLLVVPVVFIYIYHLEKGCSRILRKVAGLATKSV